jgi:hypothetical protein
VDMPESQGRITAFWNTMAPNYEPGQRERHYAPDVREQLTAMYLADHRPLMTAADAAGLRDVEVIPLEIGPGVGDITRLRPAVCPIGYTLNHPQRNNRPSAKDTPMSTSHAPTPARLVKLPA